LTLFEEQDPALMGPQMVQRKCPNCGKVYETDFPTREDAVANGGTAIQKEQHQTGICSDTCWDEFLGLA
jgi:hypothetical protein